MSKVEALKDLASVVCGVDVADVPGTNIVEVLKFIANNYPGGERLGDLIVTSVEGSSTGKTKITVTPAISSGNSYVYKINASSIETPDYLGDSSGYTAWNGTDDITAEDGHYIAICEINSSNKIVKFGQTKAVVNLG